LSRVHIARGTVFLLNGRRFQIVDEIRKDTFLAKDLDFDKVEEEFTLKHLLHQHTLGNLKFAIQQLDEKGKKNKINDIVDFSMLSQEQQDEARFRFDAIKPLLNLDVKSLNPYVKARVDKLKQEGYKVSRASLYRWLKAYRETEDVRSLVSGFYKSGPKGTKLEKEVEMIIDKIIDKHYMVREVISIKTIYELVRNEINKENEKREYDEKLNHPSLSTIRRRILARDLYEREKAKKGIDFVRYKYRQVQLNEKPKYPLQRVEMDHTELDLIVVDDENLLPIGRPTITTLLDVYTGYPLGYYIGFERASYTSVMLALKHAITPKTYVKEKYPKILNEWHAYGLPEMLVVDNGKEFLSKDLEEACIQLGIELYHCPVKTPWYKGAIERHFRTINQELLHQLPGTTFSNIVQKGDYDPKKHAFIRFNKLLELYHKWLLDYYCMEYNNGVKGVPAKLWEKAFEHNPRPAVPSSRLEWNIALMKLKYGTIQRTGIRRLHLFYQSSELSALKRKLLTKGKENRVKYKYDPTDLSKIYVYDEIDKIYIEVYCTDLKYTEGLNEYAHRIILRKAKEDAEQVDEDALAAAKAEIIQMISDEKKFSMKERSRIKRMEGKGSDKELTNEPAKPNLRVIASQQPKKDESGSKTLENFDIDIENDWGYYDAK
jgi:putative transposase